MARDTMSPQQRKTILYIDHSPKIGGAAKVLVNLINELDGSKVNPVVVCPPTLDLKSYLRRNDVLIAPADMPWFTKQSGPLMWFAYGFKLIAFAWFLRKLIKKNDVSLIHANGFIAALYAIIPAKLLRIPLAWHAHEMLERGLLETLFIRLAGRNADRIICVSEAVKTRLYEFGVDVRKCRVLYNFIPEQPAPDGRFHDDFRAEYPMLRHARIVCMIGNISKLKGQMIFIDAIRALAGRHPAAVYVIVGDILTPIDQPYKNELLELVNTAGLENKVIFTGFRKDSFRVLKECDILVHSPVLPDSLPSVLLEAMYHGKPVIASNIGGIPEIVADGKTGFLVPPGDSQALAQALDRLLKNPDLNSRLGAAGKLLLPIKFGRARCMEKLAGIYREMLPEGWGQ